MNNIVLLEKGLKKLNIELSQSQKVKIEAYLDEINLFNPSLKLVGVETEDELIIKHVLDSASAYPLMKKEMKENSKLADLGSGAGFPGIILAILFPDNKVYLVERMKRRVDFLGNVKLMCDLKNIEIISSDIDDVDEKFDIVTMRAFHPLYDIINSVDKILAKEGKIFAYKGQRVKTEEELRKMKTVSQSSFTERIEELDIPFMTEERVMCILEREIL